MEVAVTIRKVATTINKGKVVRVAIAITTRVKAFCQKVEEIPIREAATAISKGLTMAISAREAATTINKGMKITMAIGMTTRIKFLCLKLEEVAVAIR